MSNIITPKKDRPVGLPDINKMDRLQLEAYANSLLAGLQTSTKRFQLTACELQQVDSSNKIFDMGEGVFDKTSLYIVRKTLKSGDYAKMRDMCRIKRRSANLKEAN